MRNLTLGLHCKACDAPINLDTTSDTELCYECMAVVYQYNRRIIEANEADELDTIDIDILTQDTEDTYDSY